MITVSVPWTFLEWINSEDLEEEFGIEPHPLVLQPPSPGIIQAIREYVAWLEALKITPDDPGDPESPPWTTEQRRQEERVVVSDLLPAWRFWHKVSPRQVVLDGDEAEEWMATQ